MADEPIDQRFLGAGASDLGAAAGFSMPPSITLGNAPADTAAPRKASMLGKETKIGLAVIGVLLVVFSGLLFRKLTAPDAATRLQQEAARAAALHTIPQSAAAKPNVITAQRDPAVHAEGGGRDWNRHGGAGDADSDAAAPPASYMPAEDPPRDERPRDRYAEYNEPAATESEPRQGANPFHRSPPPVRAEEPQDAADDVPDAEPRVLEASPGDATVIDREDSQAARPARSAIKRASAEEPLSAEDPSEIEAAPVEAAELAPAEEQPLESDATTPTIAVPAYSAPSAAIEQDSQPDTERAVEQDEDRAEAAAIEPAAIEPAAAIGRERRAEPSAWQQASAIEPQEPALPANGKVTVGPNDTLWSISEKVYGTGGYFKAIYEYNRTALPHADRLTVGTVIAVPPASTLQQNYPTLCPKPRKSALVRPRTMPASTRARRTDGSAYVVEAGDTLFDIARYELGKASRWAEIYELNRDTLGEDFDYLQPGTELIMPPKARTESFTRQQESGIQR